MLPRLSVFGTGKRRFRDLSEKEILALAISSEEEDGRIYAAYAGMLRGQYPRYGGYLRRHGSEEGEHRLRLIDAYQRRFGACCRHPDWGA